MDLIYYPAQSLSAICQPVIEFGDELAAVAAKMMDIMYAQKGVGLAAPQVGMSLNMLILDPSGGEKSEQFKLLVNPKITWFSNKHVILTEGCLSIPGVFMKVSRPETIEVSYQDVEGNVRHLKVGDLTARIIQHEHDHLIGKLMLDRVNRHDRRAALSSYKTQSTKPVVK